MHQSDIIIIGAGAAGLMAAWGAASSDPSPSVTVLEKMPRPGRKIMISGKGRCNFTNVKEWNEFQTHIHPKANFLRPAFYNLPPQKLIDLFQDYGLESVVERGDRAFPLSHKSSDVVDVLVDMARRAGAKLVCGCAVTAVIDDNAASSAAGGTTGSTSGIDGTPGFIVNCSDGSSWRCRKLIITTGGLSYPGTGSTGDGYRWAEAFGHSLTPRFPSLTALTPKDYHYTEWISLKNVQLTALIDGNEAQSEFGDLDFTDGGIEGPIGNKVSRKCVKALQNGSKVSLLIDLKPAVDTGELDRRIQKLWDEISKDPRSTGKPLKTRMGVLLGKLLPKELIPVFTNADPKRLAKSLKSWKIDIAGYVGYERCVVTAGGVNLNEVNPKTLASKQRDNLYFAGEVLDLDADTGGYNLHIAFSTGCLAGQSAAKALL